MEINDINATKIKFVQESPNQQISLRISIQIFINKHS